MPDRQLIQRDATDEPQIENLGIDNQDLEHQANRRTRVNDAGVAVKPLDGQHSKDRPG